MRYKLLGNSGLRVSELCLGTMTFGEEWGWGASRETSRSIYDAYRAAGGNFIDTANIYTNGSSERFLGEFMAAERSQVVLSTKYANGFGDGNPNGSGNHRKSAVESVNASLQRLQTDYIDLLWLHCWDFLTPVAEVMRALDDLVRAGKILYIGISNTPAWIVAQCNTLAELRGWTSFIGLQIEYNLLQRDAERELLPMARSLDIGITAWSPLASGWLSGKYTRQTAPQASDPRRLDNAMMADFVERNQRNLAIASTADAIADEVGCSSAQVALAWLRQRGVVPIVGARTLAHIQDNLAAVKVQLTPAQMQALDTASAIELGFPHDFLRAERVQRFAYNGYFERIDNHRYAPFSPAPAE